MKSGLEGRVWEGREGELVSLPVKTRAGVKYLAQ